MTARPASDRSVLVSLGEEISLEVHRRVARSTRSVAGIRGILNLHPAFASVLVDFDPRLHERDEIEALLRRQNLEETASADRGRIIEIPVCYGGEFGPDLEDVARHAGLAPERVVELHSSAEYLVYFLGFSPGFPYLGGLPPELATPRLEAPRKRVPAGSVAIGGSQTGIYPVDSPGGWRIIGRTPLRLFDAGRTPPAFLSMGDRLRFVPTVGQVPDMPVAEAQVEGLHHGGGSIRVLSPGFQTTVQDLGRFGFAHLGVSASGAADALALRAANLLVGNAENAPALEMTLVGGAFEFDSPAVIALTGSDFETGLPSWKAVEIPAGAAVRCGATRSGARCCLAVRGGIAVPKILGSASAHVLTGVGGRPLRKGDVLPIGDAAVRRPRWGGAPAPPEQPRNGIVTLRVTPGPQADWFSDELYQSTYALAEESNRMGLRLFGPAIPSPAGHMLTEGVALGAVQVPPGGQPIILFVEHQTTGGYPKPANVISADFTRLGQLRPRDQVRFEQVSFDRALELLRAQEEWLYSLI